MLCHSILLSGQSLQLLEDPLFVDFFGSRHPAYSTLPTADHLQRDQIDKAYDRDVAALKIRLEGKFGYLIFDETPGLKNAALLNILGRFVDVMSIMPTIETPLLASEEMLGRCDAEAVILAVRANVAQFGLVTVLFLLLMQVSFCCFPF